MKSLLRIYVGKDRYLAFFTWAILLEYHNKNGQVELTKPIINKKFCSQRKTIKAIKEVKTLEGIIPICMHCKGIRDDKGRWNKLEKFISEHSEARFSHGICEECLKKYYSEYK